MIARDRLELAGEGSDQPPGTARDEIGVIEALVTHDCALVGRTAGRLLMRDRRGTNLIAGTVIAHE